MANSTGKAMFCPPFEFDAHDIPVCDERPWEGREARNKLYKPVKRHGGTAEAADRERGLAKPEEITVDEKKEATGVVVSEGDEEADDWVIVSLS